jgi:hypothetical protein
MSERLNSNVISIKGGPIMQGPKDTSHNRFPHKQQGLESISEVTLTH